MAERRSSHAKNDKNPVSEFNENVISIDRVSRVVKGGRRFRFRALVVVGDSKNRVGMGISKGGDVQLAVSKAVDVAKKNMITIPVKDGTIPHMATYKHAGANVLLKPARPGTGTIAGGTVRSIIEVTGVKNILTKSLGSNNKINVAYATIKALESLQPEENWVTTIEEEKPANKPKATAKKSTKPAKEKA